MATALIQRGQIWDCLVQFGDDTGESKRRPVVILGWTATGRLEDDRLLVVPIYTFNGDPTKARRGDIEIADPAASGLLPGSFARARRLASVSPKSFDFSKLHGSVPNGLLSSVLQEVSGMFAATGITSRTY